MSYYDPIEFLPGISVPPDISTDDISAMGREIEETMIHPTPLSEKENNILIMTVLAGECPPILISNYAKLETWSAEVGLTLLAGFCPMALTGGMNLYDLIQPEGRRALNRVLDNRAKSHVNALIEDAIARRKRTTASESCDPSHLESFEPPYHSILLRLDGLAITEFGAPQLNRGVHDTLYRFNFEAEQDRHLVWEIDEHLTNTCQRILPIWFASDLSKEEKLLPSEFVRWAINHKIHIPWLDLAKRHFPHLLPEEICRPKAVADAPTLPELKEDQQNQPPEPEDKGQHDSIPPETVTVQTSSRAKNDIFISYATDDRERLRPLVDALETAGWSVFWDRKVPAGERWRDHIPENLRASRYVIVAWSKNSISSDYVREEAEDAKNHGVLLPIYIDRVEPPFGFGELQTYDLIGWNGATDQQPFQNLVRRIAEILGQKLVTNSPIPSQKTKQGTEQLQPDKLDADDFASPSEQKTIIPHRELNE
ncbi:toll/interleukin-1 receptor domain-containing protein [Candidatus Thiosymbion oneisti]|uniref:toll/interleukin-1 receptor domain-containing protein n=1 Tax=Candidatus Thiosymbion oneisti TaxID=589554 RepID=UPI000B7E9043|nr:toll/interleukin-1 receptor domain-containing protein [Candidatus Thiosymbion oneisti]